MSSVDKNKIDLTKLFNKVFTIGQFDYSINPNFRNIRDDVEEEKRTKRKAYYNEYNFKTKSASINK